MKSSVIYLQREGLRFSARHYCGAEESAPFVVCLHGFPDNASSFRFQVDALLAAGFQVLVPSMRGYETESIPEENDFSALALVADLIAWLDELGAERVHLVGHDWGGAIAYLAAADFPGRFRSLTAIAMPHPGHFVASTVYVPVQVLRSLYMLFNQVPMVSDYASQVNDFWFLRLLWQRWAPDFQLSSAEWDNLRATFRQPGVIKAMLSYYRQNVTPAQLCGISSNPLQRIDKIMVPTLTIAGIEDGCFDHRVFDYCMLPEDFPVGLKVEKIEGAGHFPHQEKPEILNPLLIDWLLTCEDEAAET